jgi:hypothetical protein
MADIDQIERVGEQEVIGLPAVVLEDRGPAESVIDEYLERALLEVKPRSKHHGDSPHGPLPIIIGVTGHRDIREEDVSELEAELRKQLKHITSRYPSTSFILLCGLAEGADRLAAWLALKEGIRLIAVLPMQKDLYEIDFKDESLDEFRDLLEKCEHYFELPVMEGRTLEDISYRGPLRDDQYAQLGAYLVTHSQILLAIWDGVNKSLVGGTSQVVQFRLQGVPEPFAPPHSELDAPESGPVYHIVTPRRSNPEPVGYPFTLHRLYPPGFSSLAEAEKAQRSVYERMDAFNQDSLRYAKELKEKIRQSKDYLFPEHLQPTLPAMLRETLDFYAIADLLSQRFQKRTQLAFKVVLGCFFGAATFFELYAGPTPYEWVLCGYLFMFVLIVIAVKWGQSRGYHVKYLDYRALAEGLRVQFFWKLSGLRDSVADYYMRKQKSELDWIRNAVRSTMTETCADIHDIGSEADLSAQRLQQVVKYWVEDQARYFAKSAHRNHEWFHKAETWITIMFGMGIVLAIIQLFVPAANLYLLLGIALLPVAAAMFHNYLQKNAVAEHAKQYDRMSVFYHRAKLHLDRLLGRNAFDSARHFIAELGREALTENADWILTHRERPLEIPKGS